MEEHRDIAAVITAVCVVFIVIIIIGMGAVYTYSKASLMFGNENSTQSETNGNLSGVRIVQQPLPSLLIFKFNLAGKITFLINRNSDGCLSNY